MSGVPITAFPDSVFAAISFTDDRDTQQLKLALFPSRKETMKRTHEVRRKYVSREMSALRDGKSWFDVFIHQRQAEEPNT